MPLSLPASLQLCEGVLVFGPLTFLKHARVRATLVSALSDHPTQLQVNQTIQTRSGSGVMMVQGRPPGEAAAKARYLINGPKPTALQTGPEQPPEASPLLNR